MPLPTVTLTQIGEIAFARVEHELPAAPEELLAFVSELADQRFNALGES